MNGLFRPALVTFGALTLITGALYPLAVTGIAAALFPSQATGSLILREGKAVGSSLLGQDYSADPRCFWGRLSATGPVPYTAFNADKLTGSSGSNLGPTNPALLAAMAARIDALHAADAALGLTSNNKPVPVDLVTASGSGLDPHISLAAAEYQVRRVATARAMTEADVRAVIRRNTRPRQLGALGEPVVNVLLLNLDLDGANRRE